MIEPRPVVAVIVPMFNAEATVGATLDSVSAQSYPELDIIVVDDGSTDRSASIVASKARDDPRIRLIRQSNGGVAAARNAGVAATTADYLAFLDADDLWAPQKIELQIDMLLSAGPEMGLVYCWFAQIGPDDSVSSLENRPTHSGPALRQMCRSNFIGNGSSILIRREVFARAQGYDVSLRTRNAQGCEDMLLYLRVAEHYEFGLVPQHLIGYRQTNDNMSSNVMEMLRSSEFVLAEFHRKYPQYDKELDLCMRDTLCWLIERALIGGQFVSAARLLFRLLRSYPSGFLHRAPDFARAYLSPRLPRWLKTTARRVSGYPERNYAAYLEQSW